MNYAETFEQFAARTTATDLALYAGAAVVIWVLFKDKFGPITSHFNILLNKVKGLLTKTQKSDTFVYTPTTTVAQKEDLFFELVSSWKQTRDLAVKSNCVEAVNVADQMFPYLSPSGCSER